MGDFNVVVDIDTEEIQSQIDTITESQVDIKQPTGNIDATSQALSFDDSSRIFTIEPVDESFIFYIEGVKYEKTSAETVTIPDITASYFIYYNYQGVLTQSTTSFFGDRRNVFIAYIYYNATTNKGEIFARETHTTDITRNVHSRLHSQGAVYSNGLIAGDYTLIGDGSNNADASLSISDGVIYDEDLKVSIIHADTPTSELEQILSPIAKIPMGYKLSTGWQWDTATNYPLKTNTRLQYNKFTEGVGSLETVSQNDYFTASYIIATNDVRHPIIGILSQREDTTLENAIANNTYTSLDLTDLPILEFRPIYRLIFQTNSTYANTPKAKLVNIEDIRGITSIQISAIATADHNTLTNRADPNSHPSGAINYDNTTSGLDSTDVKSAIDELADEKTDKVSGATNGNFAGLNASGNLTDSGHKDSDYVHMAGNETIAGIKTFSTIPVLPATAPTTGNQAVNKTYADTKEPAITKNTAFNKNFETVNSEIQMNGVANAGDSDNVARANHVHPSDTSREPSLTKGNLTESTSAVLNISNGSNAVIGSGTSIQVRQASTVQDGYLSSNDFNTFNNKQSAITGAATTITSSNLTASKALVSDANGKVSASTISSAEVGYLSGVTSNIQTQIDLKVSSGANQTIPQLTVSQFLRLQKSDITVTSGSLNDVNIGDASFVKITSSSANFTITGLTGGSDGRVLVLYNATGNNMTISNENSGSVAANRILTNGSNIVTTGNGVVTMIYDATASRWIAISSVT